MCPSTFAGSGYLYSGAGRYMGHMPAAYHDHLERVCSIVDTDKLWSQPLGM